MSEVLTKIFVEEEIKDIFRASLHGVIVSIPMIRTVERDGQYSEFRWTKAFAMSTCPIDPLQDHVQFNHTQIENTLSENNVWHFDQTLPLGEIEYILIMSSQLKKVECWLAKKKNKLRNDGLVYDCNEILNNSNKGF